MCLSNIVFLVFSYYCIHILMCIECVGPSLWQSCVYCECWFLLILNIVLTFASNYNLSSEKKIHMRMLSVCWVKHISSYITLSVGSPWQQHCSLFDTRRGTDQEVEEVKIFLFVKSKVDCCLSLLKVSVAFLITSRVSEYILLSMKILSET